MILSALARKRPSRPHSSRMVDGGPRTRPTPSSVRPVATLAFAVLACAAVDAAVADAGGRLLATGGATTVDGAGGGGLVPWATLSGYAERDEIGGTLALTGVALRDFDLRSTGASVTFGNQLELSAVRQTLDVDAVVPDTELKQDVFGVKARLGGDLIYGRWPQFSVGALVKRNLEFDVPAAVGARDHTGIDAYLAATRLWLSGPFGRSAFANVTLRATRANQLGLLGFGGDRGNTYQLVGEASAGLFLNRHWAIGAEFRQKPDQLGFAREDDWYDVFLGWFPNKRVAVMAAYSDLGSIAGLDDQRSLYLSLQLSH